MRTATAAVVTSAVTIAIGGMIAFCRAEGPPPRRAEENAAIAQENNPSETSPAPHRPNSEGSAVPTRRWGDPEPEPVDPASAFAEELSAIRDRVGSAVPQNWESFGVPVEPSQRARFAETVEALEANGSHDESQPADAESPEPAAAALPPELADSAPLEGAGIPFELASIDPAGNGYGIQGPPSDSPAPPYGFLPPDPRTLPFESPEALAELSKLVSATARDLERLAHVREEQRRYDEADRLRRIVSQLRRENRRIVADANPASKFPSSDIGRR